MGLKTCEVVVGKHMNRIDVVLVMSEQKVDTVTKMNHPITLDLGLVKGPGHEVVVEGPILLTVLERLMTLFIMKMRFIVLVPIDPKLDLMVSSYTV